MSYELTDHGYLVNLEDWNEDVAKELAEKEGAELSEKSWDIINYLRDEYLNNNGNQPASSSAPVQMSKSARRAFAIRLGRAWI